MRQWSVVLLGLLIIIPCQGRAEESAEQVVARSWQLYRQFHDEQEQMELVIAYQDGRREEKALTRWIRYDSEKGEDKVVIRFVRPALDDGLGLLTWRHTDKEDDQWLKLPSMERVRRVSSADQDKYFAGTDLTYEDTRQLMGEQVRDFTYRMSRHDGKGWQIEATPKTGTASGYGRRVLWFNERYACTTTEYYGKGGELLKTQRNSEITYDKQGQWRPSRIEITNHLLQRATTMSIRERKLNPGLAPDTFSVKHLESSRR